jgi:hypothetical protein
MDYPHIDLHFLHNRSYNCRHIRLNIEGRIQLFYTRI